MTLLRSTLLLLVLGCSALVAEAQLKVSPTEVRLDRPEGAQQLLVTESTAERATDVTRTVRFEVQAPPVVRVDADGLIHPLAEGTTRIIVRSATGEVQVPVTVSRLQQPVPVSFVNEVNPLLTKARCNSGGCHGKAEGQNGFKLSLLGFDTTSDYEALIREGRGRRVSTTDPATSLLLRKAAAMVPHGGGRKIEAGSPQFRRMQRWLAEGAPYSVPDEQPIASIEIEPAQLTMLPNSTQQLRVTAVDAQNVRRCVTVETEFISNAGHICEVNNRGLLQSSDIPGEAAILVRYQGFVSVCRVALPRPNSKVTRPPEHNFVDKHVWDKLQQLGIQPSEFADDATYLRRAFLDVIGTLPNAVEARDFLKSTAADKRARLVDGLLNRPEYADYWAMKWSDILRADKIKVTPQGTVGLTRWLRHQFANNRPYDELAREILTVQGPVQSESPAAFFKALDQPEVASRAVSQLFLGVRIECAQCHHHPSERWSQDDYTGLAGFFTGVSLKKLPNGTDAVVSRGGKDLKHPRTGELVAARALGAPDADFTKSPDRRQVLAQWMTDPSNAFFTRAIVNRMWAHYFGRGIIDPIDDLRVTNPATNEPLMVALEQHFRAVHFDLKALTRTILASRVYQLSAVPTESNRDDRQHFSVSIPKAMPAEVLLDAISQTTGVAEKFNGWPLGVRSIHVWDNRMPSYFFRIFGRPVRATVCECERSNEPSISQALHLLNSPEVNEKIAHRQGVARRLADSTLTPDEITDEVYLSAVARFPTADERALMKGAFEAAGSDRRQAVEDVLWAVLNTKDFLYNH